MIYRGMHEILLYKNENKETHDVLELLWCDRPLEIMRGRGGWVTLDTMIEGGATGATERAVLTIILFNGRESSRE